MKNLIGSVLLSTAVLACAVTGLQAQNSLTIEQVKDGLYTISGSGGNVGVLDILIIRDPPTEFIKCNNRRDR